MPFSLKDTVRQNLLDQVLRDPKINERPGEWKILVVDDASNQILSKYITTDDLNQVYITPQARRINGHRATNENSQALYFITPTAENVDLIIKDFAGPTPKYAQGHICVTTAFDDALANKLLREVPRNRLATFKELFISFDVPESRVFSLDLPGSLEISFKPQSVGQIQGLINDSAQKLISLLLLLGDEPAIRFCDPGGQRRGLCALLAESVQQQIDVLRNDPQYNFPRPTPYSQTQLLIIDRAVDVLTPISHSPSYQSLIYDIMDMDGNQVRLPVKDSEEEIGSLALDEDDDLFAELRHAPLPSVINRVVALVKQFGKNETAASNDKLADLKEAILNKEKREKQMAEIRKHHGICTELLARHTARNLKEIGELEGVAYTGFEYGFEPGNPEAPPKPASKLIQKFIAIIENDAQNIEDRLRALAFLLCIEELNDSQINDIYTRAKLSTDDISFVRGLMDLDISPIDRDGPYSYYPRKLEKEKRKHELSAHAKKKGRPQDPVADVEAEVLSIDRHIPTLRYLLEDAILGKLDPDIFPYVLKGGYFLADNKATDSPDRGLGKVKTLAKFEPKWGKKQTVGRDQNDYRVNGARIIVFFIGGCTYPEVKVTYDLAREFEREIIIGGTELFTPKTFIESIKQMGSLTTRVPLPDPVNMFRYAETMYTQPTRAAPAAAAPRPQAVADTTVPSVSAQPALNYLSAAPPAVYPPVAEAPQPVHPVSAASAVTSSMQAPPEEPVRTNSAQKYVGPAAIPPRGSSFRVEDQPTAPPPAQQYVPRTTTPPAQPYLPRTTTPPAQQYVPHAATPAQVYEPVRTEASDRHSSTADDRSEVPCQHCTLLNPANSVRCAACDNVLHRPHATSPAAAAPAPSTVQTVAAQTVYAPVRSPYSEMSSYAAAHPGRSEGHHNVPMPSTPWSAASVNPPARSSASRHSTGDSAHSTHSIHGALSPATINMPSLQAYLPPSNPTSYVQFPSSQSSPYSTSPAQPYVGRSNPSVTQQPYSSSAWPVTSSAHGAANFPTPYPMQRGPSSLGTGYSFNGSAYASPAQYQPGQPPPRQPYAPNQDRQPYMPNQERQPYAPNQERQPYAPTPPTKSYQYSYQNLPNP
ncbi:Sec1-like protein [Polychytrium aggregatum]|uniref:Sec1-like protein n=1 Tax=Polychytrium aggregatum TaxID=110093 RepID=UPI0022FED21E|nr:Sec1-like protein [Polychytrium aggregatum]KAI9207267.1 Sec1-like protein [Polychytrium aggregatum]